jgi:hypothetical protein
MRRLGIALQPKNKDPTWGIKVAAVPTSEIAFVRLLEVVRAKSVAQAVC